MLIAGVEVRNEVHGVSVGVVVARGCVTRTAPVELDEALVRAIAVAKAGGDVAAREGSVRDMLRFGKYKPTGRGKPASEYLARAAVEDRFPRINNLVDVNNLVSLESRLPISLVDLTLASSSSFVVRRGRSGESYVFNSAGQVIELEDLLLVAHLPSDTPCANPVKDSMATKLVASSSDVMAVLYAPRSLASVARTATEAFADALTRFGDARETSHAVLDG